MPGGTATQSRIRSDQAEHSPDGVGMAGLIYAAAARAVDASINRAAFSPIMIDGALVLPEVKVGMIEASAMRRPARPRTRSWSSTTAIGSARILQGPAAAGGRS